MTMFVHSSLVLAAVVVAFAIGKKMKISTELSMFLSALVGLAVHALLPKGVEN